MKRLLFLCTLPALIMASCTKHEFRTEQITYNKTTVLPQSDKDSLIMNIEIEYPVETENQAVLPVIQKDILKALLDDDVQTTNGEEEVIRYAQKLEQIILQDFSCEDNDTTGICYREKDITGRIMGIRNNMLSYSHEDYTYLGGPHGYNTRHFYNYDLSTGKLLIEDDIFKHDYRLVLTGLLIENMIAQSEEFETIDNLMESDYEIENIVPNHNFYFTEDELVYVFNPYDIAPYYRGETEISIPLAQVQDLMIEK